MPTTGDVLSFNSSRYVGCKNIMLSLIEILHRNGVQSGPFAAILLQPLPDALLPASRPLRAVSSNALLILLMRRITSRSKNKPASSIVCLISCSPSRRAVSALPVCLPPPRTQIFYIVIIQNSNTIRQLSSTSRIESTALGTAPMLTRPNLRVSFPRRRRREFETVFCQFWRPRSLSFDNS